MPIEKMRDINAAVIGCGGIAEWKHLPSIKMLDNVKLIAFCDIVIERAQKAANEYGVSGATVYTDYKELFSKTDELEVVYVLTPNSSHAKISIAAMNAGCHVMCEKPMAHTVADARAMVETSSKTGKMLTIGYQTRSTPAAQFTRKLIKEGELGDVYYVKAPSLRRRGVPTWGVFLDKEKQGGGPMIDIGTHAIDAALFMMDNYEVVSVTGSTYRALADTASMSNEWGSWEPENFKVEDSAFGYVRFKNGATMLIEASWLLNITGKANTTMCGTKGGVEIIGDVVRVNGERNGQLYINEYKMSSTARERFQNENLTPEQYEAKQWIYCVINNEHPVTRPEQALVVSEIIEAIYASAKFGKTVYF